MKPRLVTKLDKTNTTTSNKFDDDLMSANCDAIVFFSIYGQICSYPEAGLWTHGL